MPKLWIGGVFTKQSDIGFLHLALQLDPGGAAVPRSACLLGVRITITDEKEHALRSYFSLRR